MPLRLPAPECSLHLYRHLLRETSYLPPVIRPCLTERITFLFRRHRKTTKARDLIRKGNQKLRVMRAAVDGNHESLENIVNAAYGRKGFRRRQLLADFLQREPPEDKTTLQELLDWRTGHGPPPKHLMKFRSRERQETLEYDWLDGWDTDKLTVLLQKQSRITGLSSSLEIKDHHIDAYRDVPELNSYGLPFPPKPARTKVLKFWKSMAEKALPPVPKEEWNILRDLAQGRNMERGQVLPRRPVARDEWSDLDLAKQSWNIEKYLLHPTRWVDRKSSRKRVVFTGVPQPNDELGLAPNGAPFKFRRRTLRRIYETVWRMTPFIEKKSGPKSGWNVEFGEPEAKEKQAAPHTLSKVFKGVDRNGFPVQESLEP